MTIDVVVQCVVAEQRQRWWLRANRAEAEIAAELDVPTFQRDGVKLAELCLLREEADACCAYWTRAVYRWIAKPAEA